MKTTLSTWDIAAALRADTNADWSYAGAQALAEYLEDYEDRMGEEHELDVCAVRGDFSEYESLEAWVDEYGYEGDDARDFIQDNGTLIEFSGGIIVSTF